MEEYIPVLVMGFFLYWLSEGLALSFVALHRYIEGRVLWNKIFRRCIK